MILKLDPHHPMVWRTPTSLQFGVDPALLRLDDVTEMQERMLAALAVGVSRPGLSVIARGAGDELDALVQTVSPLLLTATVARTDAVVVSGVGELWSTLRTALAAEGVHVDPVGDPEFRPDLAILVHDYVTPPAQHGAWLRRDVPHLAVIASDGALTIGPVVEPGDGPCLLCLELHRRDADPAWPAIATQLLGRTVDPPSALLLEGAAVACRLVLDRLANGPGPAVSVRIDAATGRRDYVHWQQHPECGCRGLLPLPGPLVGANARPDPETAIAGRPETGWAGAALDPVPG